MKFMALDFSGETFGVLKEKEEKQRKTNLRDVRAERAWDH
jgi:hypothetical protein